MDSEEKSKKVSAIEMVLSLVTIGLVIAGIGYSLARLTKNEPDGILEELTEHLAETMIEDTLHLPDGSIKIDITPASPEPCEEAKDAKGDKES